MSNFEYTITGRVRYDPPRDRYKRNTWWCVIELPHGLAAYLRWHLRKNWWKIAKHGRYPGVYPQAWDDHVSLVRGEKPQFPEFWKYRDGEKIKVHYSMDVRFVKDKFYVLPCVVPAGEEIRNYLGLPNERIENGNVRRFTNHITVGKTLPG